MSGKKRSTRQRQRDVPQTHILRRKIAAGVSASRFRFALDRRCTLLLATTQESAGSALKSAYSGDVASACDETSIPNSVIPKSDIYVRMSTILAPSSRQEITDMKWLAALSNPFTVINSGPSMRGLRLAAAGIIASLGINVLMGGTSSALGSLEQNDEIDKAAERDARVDKIISENGPSALPPIPMPDYYTSQPVSAVPSTTPSRSSWTTETGNDEEFARQRGQSKAEAIALYPEVADHKTPLGREVDRLIESYKATDDPILYAPNAPMLLTQIAAKNLGISSQKNGDHSPMTPDEISLMFRSGFSSQTIIQELLVRGCFHGTFNAGLEKEFTRLGASPGLIDALKSREYAAGDAEQLDWQRKQQALRTARDIEGRRLAKEAADQIAEQERSRAQQSHQIVVVPAQSEDWKFKLPSEIEAEKRAAKAAQIAARKKYCEEHPIECEAIEAAQRAQLNAEQTQSELESLKTRLRLDGVSW